MTANLRRLIQTGLLVLLALMPFHAFLSVWLGSLTGHEAVIEAWKEVLLLVLAGAGAVLAATDPATRQRLNQPLVWLVAAYGAAGLLASWLGHPGWTALAFGLKTDYEFLLAFLLALIVAERRFIRAAIKVTLGAGAMVIVFGLLQATILPVNFLAQFGYSSATVVPYQTVGGSPDLIRFASTLGGPNQLGSYLIIILALGLAIGWRYRHWWLLGLTFAGGFVLLGTHSRAAWAGAALAAAVVAIGLLPASHRRAGTAVIAALGAVLGAALIWLLHISQTLRHYLLHGAPADGALSSDAEHVQSLASGGYAVESGPLGHGLGTAGPAVFHTGQGIIIENYYLQIGYEAGWLGLGLLIALITATAGILMRRTTHHPAALALLAALAGISLDALVLPAWTDSTTALVFWVLAGAIIGLPKVEGDYV
ncbi:MAG TPA: hypothetical protein VLF67_01345 [Candidatus Saccharimonas sp.]|nr:hypothetical protein [Candidatus Saccharimonas sp.]